MAAPLQCAEVPTQSASRYLQQLAKHWSHRLYVIFTPEKADIGFPNGSKAKLIAHPDHLYVELASPDQETLAQMQTVLVEHLDRFAFREAPLEFNWCSADDSGGKA